MDVAIRLEGILIGEDKILFKPIGVMRGKYNDQDDYFIDECGCKFYSIDGVDIYAGNYFSDPISFKSLQEIYGNDKKVSEILSLYFSEYSETYYLGYLDEVSGLIKAVEMNFEDIRQTFAEMEQGLDIKGKSKSTIGFDLKNNETFMFDLKTLEELKKYQTVEEVREFIDNLIAAGQYIKDIVNEQKEHQEQEESKNKLSLKREESQKFNLKEMRDFVLSEIIAQDEAVKRITTRILTNFMSSDYRRKSHLLIMGGTGTGKSKTIELICQYLNIPFAKVDATNYTQAGYVGRSVDEMLLKLIAAADGDIELAQRGILVVDEIDKKANNGDNSGVATKAVLDTLLQITGRGTVEVDIVEDRTKRTIDFDTSNLTVILTGAFEGIEKYAGKETHRPIGFCTDIEPQPTEDVEITPQMLIKYGMTPELMGRIKCVVPLRKFEEEDYVKILKYSKGSPLQIEKHFLEADMGIKFTYTANYLKEIARQAKKLNQGARGADVAVAKSLEDVHEKVLNGEPIKVLKLTKRTAINNKEYYVEY